MRLPRTSFLHSGERSLPVGLRRRDDGVENATLVDVSGFPVSSILVITLLVVAALSTLLITGYCVLSRRYTARAAAAAAASRSWPGFRSAAAAGEKSSGRVGEADKIREGRKKKKDKKRLTMVFYQHEPKAHGYFAPLYFEERGNKTGSPPLEDVKGEISRVFEPGMLERAAVGNEEKGGGTAAEKETRP